MSRKAYQETFQEVNKVVVLIGESPKYKTLEMYEAPPKTSVKSERLEILTGLSRGRGKIVIKSERPFRYIFLARMGKLKTDGSKQ